MSVGERGYLSRDEVDALGLPGDVMRDDFDAAVLEAYMANRSATVAEIVRVTVKLLRARVR